MSADDPRASIREELLTRAAEEEAKQSAPEINGLAALLDATTKRIHRYVILTPHQGAAVALWVAHSYVFEAFFFTPYLSVQSATKQSGKTRLLEVLRPLVADPLDTDGMTPAALVRSVDAERPTLLLDETDAAFGVGKEYAEALRGILNSGFRSRGNFRKCVGDGSNMTVREFRTYCPKALSGIGHLPDTIASRSIPIRMRRRKASESVAEFYEQEWEVEALPIAARFHELLSPRADELGQRRPDRPEGISDRAKDAWTALLVVADVAGGGWPERAREAAQALCSSTGVDDQEIGVRLMDALRAAFEDLSVDRLTTHELLEHLQEQEETPWADWSRGNPISARRVADLLRPFEIHPRQIRVEDKTVKGYRLDACEDAFERYLPRNPDSKRNIRNNGSNKPETDPLRSETQAEMFRIENGHKPHEQANVSDVSDWDGPTGENGAIEADDYERRAEALGIEPWDG